MPSVRATGLQRSLVTFQTRPIDSNTGYPSATLVDVAGLVNIVCQFGPDADMGVAATSDRRQPQITDTNLHRLELDSYYPTVNGVWRDGGVATINARAYQIVGVEHDSQLQVTRCKLRLVTI